eukprot:6191391-Pleurochrysis_carterae.AAC.1
MLGPNYVPQLRGMLSSRAHIDIALSLVNKRLVWDELAFRDRMYPRYERERATKPGPKWTSASNAAERRVVGSRAESGTAQHRGSACAISCVLSTITGCRLRRARRVSRRSSRRRGERAPPSRRRRGRTRRRRAATRHARQSRSRLCRTQRRDGARTN